jgi:hypothetical protein
MTQQKKRASVYELADYLGAGGKVLRALGFDSVPTESNPVWLALAGLAPFSVKEIEELVELKQLRQDEADQILGIQDAGTELAALLKSVVWRGKTPQKSAILQAYIICQTACLNEDGGPLQTGDLGTIRQRWYASKNPMLMGFKFAAQALERYLVRSADVVLVPTERARNKALKQGAARVEYKVNWSKADEAAFALDLGRKPRVHIWPKDGWGRVYSQQHSGMLANLVRNGLTYEELWIRDASRKFKKSNPLLPGFMGILVIEKEGLLEHFSPIAERLGIPILLSMKGKNAFSVVESILNDNFRDWEGQYKPTEGDPLHFFSITDHDYSGHIPVQNAAAAQFERYLPDAVKVWRVGITPDQLRDAGKSVILAGYELEMDNKAEIEWADDEAVWVGDTAYGIEIEALTPQEYVPYLVDALVEAVGGDEELRKRLAEMAEPDWWDATSRIEHHTYLLSELWRRLEAVTEWAGGKRADVESPIDSWVNETVGPEYDVLAWRNKGYVKEAVTQVIANQSDAMSTENFVAHVAGDNWGKWKPVSSGQATAVVTGLFIDEFGQDMKSEAEGVDADEWALLDAVRQVFNLLEDHGLELEIS